MRIQKAHFVMLAQEELLSKEDIAAIKAALGNVPYEEFYNSAYDKHHEDMYYTLEAWMMKQYGDGCGNLHIGRSRNDIGSATVRIQVREQLLVMLDTLHRLHHAVIAFSKEHRDLIMVAHTHTQQAQIGTLGHTMIAFAKVLERCIKRLQRAYDGNNLSPMGAAAIETSGFAVNRDTVCRLLGFDGLVENSYDCIAGGDHFSETACAVEITALEIGRMVANFLLWNTQEFDLIRSALCYVCTSSIMPQKRNPTVIEFIRKQLSVTIAECDGVLRLMHNITYEDIGDVNAACPQAVSAMKRLTDIGELFYRIIATMKVEKEAFAKWARETFAGVTEFSDMLVREEGINYRLAHHVAHEMAGYCVDNGITLDRMDMEIVEKAFADVVGRKLTVSREKILASLDSTDFVRVRGVAGGPAAGPMQAMLENSLRQYEDNLAWIAQKREKLAGSEALLNEEFERVGGLRG